MAFYHLILFAALFLVLQPIVAHDGHDHNSTTFLENLCEDVECGKGTCKASLDYAFNFICECDPGWKQIRDDEDDDDDKDRFGGRRFQPCIYPNCTMNYACGAAPPPTPNVEEPHPKNISQYDPCYWAYCGDGTCNATNVHGFKCDCRPGFRNLMNITSFPCFSDCVIGSDCASLGVTLSNETAVSSPNSPSNYASSIMPSFLWLIVLMVPVAMAP